MNDSYKESIPHFDQWFAEYRKDKTKHAEHLAGMDRYNLTEEEAGYVLTYTGFCARWVNPPFRAGHRSPINPEVLEYANNLKQTLDKIPSYNNQTVIRNSPCTLNFKKALIEQPIGLILRVPFFLSTSKDKWPSQGDSDEYWEIKTADTNSKAKDICDLTSNSYENEVLFNQGTLVRIDRITDHTTYMTEITDGYYDIDMVISNGLL